MVLEQSGCCGGGGSGVDAGGRTCRNGLLVPVALRELYWFGWALTSLTRCATFVALPVHHDAPLEWLCTCPTASVANANERAL